MRRFLSRKKYAGGVNIGRYSKISKDSEIGSFSYIGRNCSVSKARIGRYVSVANNVSIGNGEHNLKRISTNSIFYEDAYSELTKGECIIGDDVWIAVDAIIRRGVTIGFGAVVGANTFVNSDVPAFAIVVGSPNRIVGYRFTKEQQAKILSSRWWENEPIAAKKMIETLESEFGISED